jgi:murein DD-endopeptidase MepM/ murein hydrolase activator NlpD
MFGTFRHKVIVTIGLLVSVFGAAFFTTSALPAFAQDKADEIKSVISDRQAAIDAITSQISELDRTINNISGQRESLERDRNLMRASIARIQAAEKKAQLERNEKERDVDAANNAIATIGSSLNLLDATQGSLIRSIAEYDRTPMVALVAGNQTISDAFVTYESYSSLRTSLEEHSAQLSAVRVEKEHQIADLKRAQQELQVASQKMADQRTILQDTEKKQAKLVADTKNQESQYRASLDALLIQKTALDTEIRNYESQLQFLLDPKQLPPTGSQVLSWPLQNVYITQRFGQTVDSKRLYTSGSHSGVDFRAAVGTPVYAVADGVVEGVGDTDKTCPKTSFGKWVFIRHSNGLATAYGHLSLIKTVSGQNVKRGDLIAYSGATGHVTGPHLHMTVYASHGLNGEEGAGIKTRPSTTCPGKTYTMPLAPTSAYLDPMLYLPVAGAGMFKN